MKTSNIFLSYRLLLLCRSLTYTPMMIGTSKPCRKTFSLFTSAKSIGELQNSVNTLERIAATEKIKWEPYYYVSFGYIMMANREQEAAKKDVYLDQANASIEKAIVN